MKARILRLPSPALVVAMIALLLVLSGTAIAAGTVTYLTTTSGTKLVKKLAPSLSVKHAKTAGNASQLGGAPAASYEAKNAIMWAVVTNNGTTAAVSRSTGGITVSRQSTGIVYVTFPRNVSACAWIATQGNGTSVYDPSAFATVRGNNNASDVEVITYDDTGSYVDDNFHVLVAC